MGTTPYMEAITELQNPGSAASTVAALKYLKNEAIGHAEKKEAFVAHGLINLLSQILHSSVKARGKRKGGDLSHDSVTRGNQLLWTEEDEARLQAILLLNCLAHSGAPFVTPILASSACSTLLTSLSPTENPPKIVLAALKTLVTLAETAEYTSPKTETFQNSVFNEELYTPPFVQALTAILAYRPGSGFGRNSTTLICRLIAATCKAEHHRQTLLSGGMLDLLAATLANCYLQQRPWGIWPNPALAASLPTPPAPHERHILFSAIYSVVGASRYRVARLLYSPVILSVFSFRYSDIATHSRSHSISNDVSLPKIQNGSSKSDSTSSKAFPALGSVQPVIKTSATADLSESAVVIERSGSSPALLSSVVAWLVHVIRSEQDLCRLEAANLLTAVVQAGFLERNRDRMLALLVVPLIADALEGSPHSTNGDMSRSRGSDLERDRIKERAPVVLSRLIGNSPTLQKAATEASAIERLCKLLKSSFEKEDTQPVPWKSGLSPVALYQAPPSCRLGPPALRRGHVHRQKIREGSLLLLAAIAEKEDKYRKILTDNGVIACVIDSLVPFSEEKADDRGVSLSETNYSESTIMGNDVPVLLAACKAARNLSRSVKTLRTSLIDAGIAKPVFALLRHSNVSVLIEATNVVCNLITDFSPMRHDLVEAGAIKTLCEHAHSADSEIRLVSLWALKHLIFQSPNDVKIQCFEELETGWLVQIITGGASNGGARPSRNTNPLAMGVANAAGERVDILNATDEHMDTGEEAGRPANDGTSRIGQEFSDNDLNASLSFMEDFPELLMVAEQHRTRLNEIKEADERAIALQAHNDELTIRVQGLDFIRNLIQGAGAADMIDTLFQYLGANRVFDIVASKLKTEVSARNGAADSSLHLPSSSIGILDSTCFILVHLAAGAPRHRQQLMSQTQILRSLLSLLSHSEPRIRVSCAWVVCNLTWIDDKSDQSGARQRAAELRRLGFEEALRSITNDEVLDVRERVGTAIEQIQKLLDSNNSSPITTIGGQGR